MEEGGESEMVMWVAYLEDLIAEAHTSGPAGDARRVQAADEDGHPAAVFMPGEAQTQASRAPLHHGHQRPRAVLLFHLIWNTQAEETH